MKKEEREREKRRALTDANQAKDRLYEIAQRLESLGYKRKAASCMTIIYNIEKWQNCN